MVSSYHSGGVVFLPGNFEVEIDVSPTEREPLRTFSGAYPEKVGNRRFGAL